MVAPSKSWGDKIGATGGNSGRSVSGGAGGMNGSAGRPGGMGNQGQTNRSELARSYPGQVSNPSQNRPGGVGYVAGAAEQKRLKDYKAAVDEYANRGLFGKVFDFMAGPFYDAQEPTYGNPNSYYGGKYHTSYNPAGMAGALLGSALGAGFGFPGTGTLGGILGKQFGDDHYYNPGSKEEIDSYGLGSPSNTVGPGLTESSFGGGTPDNNGPGGSTQAATHLQNLASLNQAVSGNPGAPVLTGPATPTPPAGPTPSPNWSQMMASIQEITPGYSVSLPAYRYRKRPA